MAAEAKPKPETLETPKPEPKAAEPKPADAPAEVVKFRGRGGKFVAFKAKPSGKSSGAASDAGGLSSAGWVGVVVGGLAVVGGAFWLARYFAGLAGNDFADDGATDSGDGFELYEVT